MQPTAWEKIFTAYTSSKRLVARTMYEGLFELTSIVRKRFHRQDAKSMVHKKK